MYTIQICSLRTLENDCNSKCRGIAFDGCFFYITNPVESAILKYDLTFGFAGRFSGCGKYTSICFDTSSKCFFAVSFDDPDRIYMLDGCFKEVNSYSIKNVNLGQEYNAITGISCCRNNRLILSGNFGIVELDLSNMRNVNVRHRPESGIQYTSVEAMKNGYVYTFRQGQCQLVGVIESCDNEQIQCRIPEQYCVEDITDFVPAKNSCRTYYLLITKQGGCSCVLQIKVCCISHGDPCAIKPCDGCGCERDCKENICDIIESIALVETAISHVVNAEGEKIQKILGISNDICEILKVNEMVNQTLQHVTQLETVLCEKLRTVTGYCNKNSQNELFKLDSCKNKKI